MALTNVICEMRGEQKPFTWDLFCVLTKNSNNVFRVNNFTIHHDLFAISVIRSVGKLFECTGILTKHEKLNIRPVSLMSFDFTFCFIDVSVRVIQLFEKYNNARWWELFMFVNNNQ